MKPSIIDGCFKMQIITELERNVEITESVVTVGTFDGLHTGHLEIIKTLNEKSESLNLASVVVTFYPHPRTVITKDFDLKLLTPLEEKKQLLKDYGIDYLIVIPFNEEFAQKSYNEFFDQILISKLNVKYLVIGYDHKFGKGREGDSNKLSKYANSKNIGFTIVGPKEVDNIAVSSTKVRNAIANGEVELASKMLDRNYFLDGVVIEGAKRGRTLGFPTANLGLNDNNKLVPKNGVYLVEVSLDSCKYYGVANIGLRPTFNHVEVPITEVFILDFSEQIYGNQIKVEFLKRIRDEKKFSSKEELELNIRNDVEKAKELIKEFE